MHNDVHRHSTVQTAVVHRITRGPVPWWHTAVICDFTGGVDDAQLANIRDLLVDIADVGFDAICIRPEHVDSVWGPASPLPAFTAAAHGLGLKVVVRLPGASLARIDAAFFDGHDALAALLGRVGAALDAGADGIDLGSVAPRPDSAQSPVERARLRAGISRLSRIIMSESSMRDSGPILTASVSGRNGEALRHHLNEDWFHHLRDGSLRQAPWEADGILSSAVDSLMDHDHLGAVSPWYWSRVRRTNAVEDADESAQTEASWEAGADRERHGAMTLFALSLPGAAYPAFGRFGGGRLNDEAAGGPRRSWACDAESSSEADLMAEVLRIRREHRMGAGSMGVLSGLEWVGAGATVHVTGGVTVVLNTGEEAVAVPTDQSLLVASRPTMRGPGGTTVVPPSTCAWFITAPVEQVRVEYWD